MFLVMPLVVAIMMLIIVIAFAALSFAFAVAASAMTTAQNTANTRFLKLTIALGGVLVFVAGWLGTDPVNGQEIDALFNYAIKVTFCLLFTALAMICVAVALRITAALIKRRPLDPTKVPTAFLGATLLGLVIGGVADVVILRAMEQALEDPAPLVLSLEGEPTHCVWRQTQLYENQKDARFNRSRYALKLMPGDKVRIEPNVVLTFEVFTVRFQIMKDGVPTTVFGKSVEFRSLEHVDAACNFR